MWKPQVVRKLIDRTRQAQADHKLRHRHPLLNTMLKPLLGLVPHHDAPERNPFKVRK